MYYEDAKENAAFERCTDVITNMIMKYGPVLKRKWAVDEWLRNIHVECFGTKNEWRSFMAEDKKTVFDCFGYKEREDAFILSRY